jgi:hypothetical protein
VETKKRILAHSTLLAPSTITGNPYPMPQPCLVYGIHLVTTGAVLLEYVWCDNRAFYPAELEDSEIENFTDELKHAVIWGDF